MKMFKVMAAFMLGIAFCLGFTACSDNDENGNGNDGDNTTTVVNPEKVFTGGLPNLSQACLSPKMKRDW